MRTKTSQCSRLTALRQVIWERSESPVIQPHKIFKSTVIDFWKALLEHISAGAFYSHPGWGGISIWGLGPTAHCIYTVNGTKSFLSSRVEALFLATIFVLFLPDGKLARNLTSALLLLLKPLRRGDISTLGYLDTYELIKFPLTFLTGSWIRFNLFVDLISWDSSDILGSECDSSATVGKCRSARTWISFA